MAKKSDKTLKSTLKEEKVKVLTKTPVKANKPKTEVQDKEQNRANILRILLSKAALKQDIFQRTKETFANFKTIIELEINELSSKLTDERIRCQFIDKGEFEAQVFIGSDVLIFLMHTNVFRFPDEHGIWKTEYLKDDATKGYVGMINVYNFLADSFNHNRTNDAGYLIGRLFLNRDDHFMVEGKGQLGFLFRDFDKLILSEAIIKHVVQCSFAYALEFDLFTPPYEMMAQVSVGQLNAMSSNIHIQTGKRLGFRFEGEDKEFR